MQKKILMLSLLIFFSSLDITSYAQKERVNNSKYVFLFIADGMGMGQVTMTEAYLASQRGKIGNDPLSFSRFPVMGMVTTYSANSFITCSAAAGTAMSTGFKTNNYMLGVSPDSNKLTSIAYKIHNTSIPVGILTTVTIDHATPGAFYASSVARNDYYSISTQIPSSGFEFFAGGGFIQPNGKDNNRKNIYKVLEDSGYTVVRGLKNLGSKKDANKIALFQEQGKELELPFAIDRQEGDLSLTDILKAAIDHLYSKKGFFIMAEGGKIDWAAHSNDAKTTILEILDLSDAIEIAYQFYLKHPNETLIVVTTDHDTGGMSLGSEKGSKFNLRALDDQKNSFTVYDSNSLSHDDKTVPAYMGYSKAAGVGWTTTGHLGNSVPLFSVGSGSQIFSGRMDNTEIPKKILKIMGIEF